LKSINVYGSLSRFRSIDGVLYSLPGPNLFYYPCGKSDNYVIPDGVVSINSGAFDKCFNLKSVTIPSSVHTVSDYAFSYCNNLENVTIFSGDYSPNSSAKLSIGNYAFEFCSSLTSVLMSPSVTSIGMYAFQSCSSLTNISIPPGVSTIGKRTFSDCVNLVSVTIPTNITSIDDYAFSGCRSLASITIPESVTTIGDYAFEGCKSLTALTIPSEVSSIGNGAFEKCTSLTYLTVLASNPPQCPTNPFSHCEFEVACIPEGSNYSSLCGVENVLWCKSSSCDDIFAQSNPCFRITQCGEGTVQKRQMRAGGVEWESHTNGCVQYYCDIMQGKMSRSKCETGMCVNDECADSNGINRTMYTVVMGVNRIYVNTSEIYDTLSDSTGRRTNGLDIGSELDESGRVLRIFVMANDIETATLISELATRCSQGGSEEGCTGFLGDVLSSTIVTNELFISDSPHVGGGYYIMITLVFSVLLTLINFI